MFENARKSKGQLNKLETDSREVSNQYGHLRTANETIPNHFNTGRSSLLCTVATVPCVGTASVYPHGTQFRSSSIWRCITGQICSRRFEGT